jgi:LmbE family N-acetylglucosaminyl deacetylase
MESSDRSLNRRDILAATFAGTCSAFLYAQEARAEETPRDVFLERAADGAPHKGKVLLAVQAHSDDIPLMAGGTVAKLVKEGYTGYLLRATNDDMGDAPGLGTPGTIGDHVLGNERDNAEVARVLGLKKAFDLNYSNHRMADVSLNELQCRLIFLIRLLKVDTVVCWDPWGHDEENPDHTQIARGVEAACWMAGRAHDFPEQFAAGLAPHAVQEKYYYARRPEVTRVVDVSGVVDQMIDSNRANRAKGPAGNLGSRLRAKLAKQGQKLALLGDDDVTADRNYIKEFILARRRALGQQHGVQYAEAFHHIGGGERRSAVDDYVKKNAVPNK